MPYFAWGGHLATLVGDIQLVKHSVVYNMSKYVHTHTYNHTHTHTHTHTHRVICIHYLPLNMAGMEPSLNIIYKIRQRTLDKRLFETSRVRNVSF